MSGTVSGRGSSAPSPRHGVGPHDCAGELEHVGAPEAEQAATISDELGRETDVAVRPDQLVDTVHVHGWGVTEPVLDQRLLWPAEGPHGDLRQQPGPPILLIDTHHTRPRRVARRDRPVHILDTTGISHMTINAPSASTATAAPPPPRSSTPPAFAWFGAAAAALVVCAACAAPGRGSRTAPTAAATESTMTPSVPFGGAPAVTDPLPAAVLDGDPCTDALTPAQVETAIGVRVPGVREDLPQTGPACAWTNQDTGGAVGVSYTINTHTGLSSVYANTRPQSAIWRPLPPVQGLPAVAHAGSLGQSPPLGFCQASVGLADTYSVDISLHLGRSKRSIADPCGEPLRQICDLVITTLRVKGRP